MLKLFSTIFIFFISTQSYAQKERGFNIYADSVNRLMMKAYEVKDVEQYQSVFSTLRAHYDKLDSTKRAEYISYIRNAYYNLACTYALLGEKKQALQNLEMARKWGYNEYYHMIEDSDIDTLRSEKEYKVIMSKIRLVGDYDYILKRARDYNRKEKRGVPVFTYQSKDDTNLVRLRKKFNLDSVAGNANEVSQIISLMRWVHNIVPHHGGNGNPDKYDAYSMIDICTRDNRTLNCRGLATVLNECYLSMGFPSRLVTCLPKDSLDVDNDCHVINMVYSRMLDKWLWMDPTFEAYVMNEKGELLGIPEVRERLINDKPLIINPDANWNHRSSQNVEDYLEYYMTKNLYMFSIPLHSRYSLEGMEHYKRRVYVKLYPLDYYKQKPVKREIYDPESGKSHVEYITNDDEKYWAKPLR